MERARRLLRQGFLPALSGGCAAAAWWTWLEVAVLQPFPPAHVYSAVSAASVSFPGLLCTAGYAAALVSPRDAGSGARNGVLLCSFMNLIAGCMLGGLQVAAVLGSSPPPLQRFGMPSWGGMSDEARAGAVFSQCLLLLLASGAWLALRHGDRQQLPGYADPMDLL